MCVYRKCTKKIEYRRLMLHLIMMSQTEIHHRVNILLPIFQAS